MIKSIYKSLRLRLMSSTPSNFLKDNDGIAAIEFAFIAPIMIFMYFGMAEVATAISVDRQVSHSANVAGDLATQTEVISAAQMSEIMTATLLVMGIPESERSSVKMEIESFGRAANGDLIKNGRATLNGPYPSTFNANDLDDRILSNTSGVVVARVLYNYKPLNLRYTSSNIDLQETFMLKPRQSINVDIEETNGGTTSNQYKCDFVLGKPSCGLNGNVT